MIIRTLIVAAVLAVAPTLGLAGSGCGWGDHERQVMSCAEGTVWDDETRTCIKIVG